MEEAYKFSIGTVVKVVNEANPWFGRVGTVSAAFDKETIAVYGPDLKEAARGEGFHGVALKVVDLAPVDKENQNG